MSEPKVGTRVLDEGPLLVDATGRSLAMTADEYLTERVQQYEDWYDRKTSKMKKWYLRLTGTAVVASALVPVLVNLEFEYANAVGDDAFRLFVNRIEGAIAAENASTLKIMTLGEHGERQARADGP